MSDFNNDEYLKGQVRKQVMETIEPATKLVLSRLEVISDLDLIDKTVDDLQAMVASGQISYYDITAFYLDRIYHHEHYNSVIEINELALHEAKEKTYNKDNHDLYGLPVLVKGNIGTAGMKTNAGASAIRDLTCEDAAIIQELKDKGAIILGKTNLSEWANFMSTESSNGYSSLGGQTINPHGNFDVGGSSSGSAVATYLQLAPVTIGTETAGSIIYPASQNAIVGLKPTFGLLSQDKIIPISKSHDTAGPMGKRVKDVYKLLSAMTGVEDMTYDKDALKGKQVGIVINKPVKGYYRLGDDKIIEKGVMILKGLGAHVEDYALDDQAFETKVYDILKYEFREGVKEFLSKSDSHCHSLGDIIHFNQQDMALYAPYNHEIIKQAYEEYFDPDDIDRQIEINRQITQAALDKAFEEVDVLMTLSNYLTSVYAPAGYPALCLPVGKRASGEPVGLTLIARAGEDVKLLTYAYAFEQGISDYEGR